MILEKGNMWDIYDQTDLFLITANSSLNNKGELIMGAGIAKEVKEKFPNLSLKFGQSLKEKLKNNFENNLPHDFYGLFLFPGIENIRIGLFQTKFHWSNPSNLYLVFLSTAELLKEIFLCDEHSWGYSRIDLNFPGIGKGQLSREEVLPIISVLPDNVHIWEF